MQIVPGGISAFNGTMYGAHDQGTLQFFQNQMQDFAGLSNSIYADRFARDMTIYYERYNGYEAQQAAQLAKEYIVNINQPDLISWLSEITQIQSANKVMQRFILANPYIRGEYQNQRCDGYSNTYQDMFPGKIGENHYDYLRVVDGIVQDTKDENGGDTWSYITFLDDHMQGEPELTFRDQRAILNTWQIAELIMKQGKKDPTNQEGGNL